MTTHTVAYVVEVEADSASAAIDRAMDLAKSTDYSPGIWTTCPDDIFTR